MGRAREDIEAKTGKPVIAAKILKQLTAKKPTRLKAPEE
jgi:hypothetical protein